VNRRYQEIEALMTLKDLEPVDRVQITMAVNKLSEPDKAAIDKAIGLLTSEIELASYLAAQKEQTP
jgi:hypothetical protein